MMDKHTIMGIIVCDLDGLKVVNDTLGHQHGDKVLKAVAEVLKQCFAEDDMIARIGGDEFIVLLPGISREGIEEARQKIYNKIDAFNFENIDIRLSMSVGVAVSDDMPINISNLFNVADANMYQQKRQRSGLKTRQ